MGLDMYLYKAKRIDNATPETVANIEKYFSWCLRPEKYRNSTPRDWSGCDYDALNLDLAKAYCDEYKVRYWSWDTEKNYPHHMISQMLIDWRKANHIHKWFVDHVCDGKDDCEPYEVEEYQLEDLLSICKTIKANVKLVNGTVNNGYTWDGEKMVPITDNGKVVDDPELCARLLPTKDGFFFGGTDYDQWYMDDIEYTIQMLEKVLKEIDWDNEMVWYEASW